MKLAHLWIISIWNKKGGLEISLKILRVLNLTADTIHECFVASTRLLVVVGATVYAKPDSVLKIFKISNTTNKKINKSNMW